jgi:hypothetical protein
LGRTGTFDRMWQLGFPSPHLHYLDTDSVSRLAEQTGFELVRKVRLPSVAASGLYSRIRYSNSVSRLGATFVAVAVLLSMPVLRVLPSDISVWYLRRVRALPIAQ